MGFNYLRWIVHFSFEGHCFHKTYSSIFILWMEEWEGDGKQGDAREKKKKNRWSIVFVHLVALARHFVKWKILASRFSFRKCILFSNLSAMWNVECRTNIWCETTSVCENYCMQTNKLGSMLGTRPAHTHPFFVTLVLWHIPKPTATLWRMRLYGPVVIAVVLVEHNLEGFLLDLVTYVNLFDYVFFNAAIDYYSDSGIFEKSFLQFSVVLFVGRCRKRLQEMCVCVWCVLYCILCVYRYFTVHFSCPCIPTNVCRHSKHKPHYICFAYAYFSICTRDIRVGPDKKQLKCTSGAENVHNATLNSNPCVCQRKQPKIKKRPKKERLVFAEGISIWKIINES